MKTSENKEKLNLYLAAKFIDLHANNTKVFLVTYGNTVKSNTPSLLSNQSISICEAEEADQKLIRHMLQCVQSDVKRVTMKTVDSDVVILAQRK